MSAAEPAVVWWLEIGKSLLLFAITGMLGIVWRLLVKLRDDGRDMKREVSGSDGKNGLKSEMREVKSKIGELEDWMLVMESVMRMRGMYDAAQHEHHGEERRHPVRRLRAGDKDGG